MAELIENASVRELQKYQEDLCRERGWDKSEDLEVFLLLSEEFGELAKAIRNMKGLYLEKGKDKGNFKDELDKEFADVLGYLLELANQMGVDLQSAFRKKELANRKREWLAKKKDKS